MRFNIVIFGTFKLFILYYYIEIRILYIIMSSITETQNTTHIDDKPNDKTTTLDSTTYQMVSDKGTYLTQNQPIKAVTENQRIMELNLRADRHMDDADWDLRSMLSRKNFVGTYEWNTGQAQWHEIVKFENPYDLLKQEIARRPFETFTYARWKKLIVYFQLQATRWQCGQLQAYFHPTMVPEDEISDLLKLEQYINRENSMLLNHFLLDAQQSDMCKLEIPFVWNKGWLDLNAQDVLGSVHLRVFNKLQAATGTSTSATVNVYMSLEDAQFRIPRPLPPVEITKPIIKKKEIILFGEKQSALLGTVNEVTKFLEPFAGMVDTMAGLFLDKKQISANPYPIIQKKQGYLTHQKNEEYVDRFTINPNTNQMTDQEHYNSDISVLKADYMLKQKWNIIDTFQYSNVTGPGTVLASYNVGPMGWTFSPATTKTLTTVDYLTRRFQFWRGAFLLMLQVVATPMHEGRILVVFRPAVDRTVAASYDEAQSQYVATFQIKGGQNCFAVRVPFLSQTPYNLVYAGQTIDTANFNEYFNGSIQIISGTNLKVTANLVNQVEVNAFLATAEDFEIHTPTFDNLNFLQNTNIPPSIVKAKNKKRFSFVEKFEKFVFGEKQSDKEEMLIPATPNDLPSKVQAITLCAEENSRVSDPKTSHFGEHYTDFQQILKRYQPGPYYTFDLKTLVDANIITSTDRDNIIAGYYPLVFDMGCSTFGDSKLSVLQGNNLLADISACFRLQRTPMAFKVKVESLSSPVSGYVTYMKNKPAEILPPIQTRLQQFFPNAVDFSQNTVGGPFMPLSFFDKDQQSEFYLPFLHHQATSLILQPYDIAPTYATQNGFNDVHLIAAIYGIQNETQRIDITTFCSFSDEATFGAFQGLPALYIQKT